MLHLHGKSSEQTIVDISACYAPLQNAFCQPPSYHIIDHRTVPLTLFLVNQCSEEKCIHYLSQNIKPEYVVEGLKQSDFVHLSPLLLLIFLCDQEGQRIDSCIDYRSLNKIKVRFCPLPLVPVAMDSCVEQHFQQA